MKEPMLRILSVFVVALCCAALPVLPAAAELPEKAISRTHDEAALSWGPCPPIFPSGCQVAVLHGDPAVGRSDVFLRVPGGDTLAPHWHSSAEHMVLVAGELQITYKGQPAVTLRPGSYAYGPANAPHNALCVGPIVCVLFIAFESPIDAEAFSGGLE